jgi:hypothetical protein
MDLEQMELDVLELLVQWGCYVSPDEFDYDTRERVNRSILDSYEEYIHKNRMLPTVNEIYRDLRLGDFSDLHRAATYIVDQYMNGMTIDEKIYFCDMGLYKDTVSDICFDIEKFIEQAGYKRDLCQYIKTYITGLGYAIFTSRLDTEDRNDYTSIIAGDAQNYFDFGNPRDMGYMVVSRNVFAEIRTQKGGVLIV